MFLSTSWVNFIHKGGKKADLGPTRFFQNPTKTFDDDFEVNATMRNLEPGCVTD